MIQAEGDALVIYLPKNAQSYVPRSALEKTTHFSVGTWLRKYMHVDFLFSSVSYEPSLGPYLLLFSLLCPLLSFHPLHIALGI